MILKPLNFISSKIMLKILSKYNNNLEAGISILSTRLYKRASKVTLSCGIKKIKDIVFDLLEITDTLIINCHMPEFTDHGLFHLKSIIKRMSNWTLADGSYLVEKLTPAEAALLLMGLLVHDIGMISQNPLDLGEGFSYKGMMNVADWVRLTHCKRLPGLLERVLNDKGYKEFINSDFFKLLCLVAMAHQEWPWEEKYKERGIRSAKKLKRGYRRQGYNKVSPRCHDIRGYEVHL